MIADSYHLLLTISRVWHIDESPSRKPWSWYCRSLGFDPKHPDAKRAYGNGHTWAHRRRREELHPELGYRRKFRQAA